MQATDDEKRDLATLAIGRLLRICSRPYQPGDDVEYTRVRQITMDTRETPPGYSPNYARDRFKGAAGD